MKVDTQEHIKWLCTLVPGSSGMQPHKMCKAQDSCKGIHHTYECGYKTKVQCFECKYGHGRRDPNAKSNKLKYKK